MNLPMEKRYNRTKVKRQRKDLDERRGRTSVMNMAEEHNQGSKEKHNRKSVSQFTKVVREFGERREHFDSTAYAGIMTKVRIPSTVTKGRLTAVGHRGMFMRSKVSKTITRGSPLNELNKARLDDNLFQIIRLANNEPADQPRMQATHSVNQPSAPSVHQETYSPLLDDPPTPCYAKPSKRLRSTMQGPSTASVANASDNIRVTHRFSPKVTSTAAGRPKPRGTAERAREDRRKANLPQSQGFSSSSTSGGYKTGGSVGTDGSPPVYLRNQVTGPDIGSYEYFASEMTDQLTVERGNFKKKTDFLKAAKVKLQGFYRKSFKRANTSAKPSSAELKSKAGVESASGERRQPLLPVPCSSALQGALTGVSCSSLYKTATPRSTITPVPLALPIRANQPQHSLYQTATPRSTITTVPLALPIRANQPQHSLYKTSTPRSTITTVPLALPIRANQPLGNAKKRPRSSVTSVSQQQYLPAATAGSAERSFPAAPRQQHRACPSVEDEPYAFSPYVPPPPVFDDPVHFLRETLDKNALLRPKPVPLHANPTLLRAKPLPPRRHRGGQMAALGVAACKTYQRGGTVTTSRYGRCAASPELSPVVVKRLRSSYCAEWNQRPQLVEKTSEWNQRPQLAEKTSEWNQRQQLVEEASKWNQRPQLLEVTNEWNQRPQLLEVTNEWNQRPQLVEETSDDCEEGMSQEMRNIDEWFMKQEQQNSYCYLQATADSSEPMPLPVLEDSGIDVAAAPCGLNPWESLTPERKFFRRRLH